MVKPEIRVHGLAELRKALRQIEDAEGLREVREGLKRGADIVAREAKTRVPSRTGTTASSIRATAGGNRAFVVGGKAKVPWYGWLDFGSRTPRTGNARTAGPWKGSGKGPRKGRFIYPALDARESDVAREVEEGLVDAIRRAGF